jgi:hypothetical protein
LEKLLIGQAKEGIQMEQSPALRPFCSVTFSILAAW